MGLEQRLQAGAAGGALLNRGLAERRGIVDPLVRERVEPTESVRALLERGGRVVDVLRLIVADVEMEIGARRERRGQTESGRGRGLVALRLPGRRVDRVVGDVHVAEAIRVGLRDALLRVADEGVAAEPLGPAFLRGEIELVGALAAKRVAEIRRAGEHGLADAEIGPEEIRVGAAVEELGVHVDVEVVAVAGGGRVADDVFVETRGALVVPAALHGEGVALGVEDELLELDRGHLVVILQRVGAGEVDGGPVEESLVVDAGHGRVERRPVRIGGAMVSRRRPVPAVLLGPLVAVAAGAR